MPDALLKNNLKIFIGSAFGLGLSPVAPGSFGALLGVIFHILVVSFLPDRIHLSVLMAGLLLVCYLNHRLTPWAVSFWKEKDPKHFVLDEVAGYLVIPILFPYGQIWKSALLGYLIIRVFDVLKICPPARYIDRNIHGSWGILLDDIVSGTYAAGALYLINYFIPGILS